MKAVNVDEVLKILHKYGKYIFITDMKKYSSMVDEIANLKALDQESNLDKIRAEMEKIPTAFATAYTAKNEALQIIDKYIEGSEK